MANPEFDRRNLLAAGVLAAGLSASTGPASAQTPPARPAATFQPKPLPLDAAKVPGLSERLLRSHYDNNYTGAVRRLGQIETELATLDPATAPGYRINGLKREELLAWNSMVLHELYFAGLAGPGAVDARLGAQIEKDFGSQQAWAADFAATGKALGGGSGWVLLTWSGRDRRLVNQWAADHTMTLAGGTPILALDMYEHAYHMDFGAQAGAYVDAFMKAVSWNTANATFARAAA